MTAISFSAMNLAIRKGGRAYPGENAVLATLAVNISVFTLLLLGAMVTGSLREVRLDAALAFASIGVTGPFLGRTFLFAGIHRVGVVRASAIKNAAPIVTLLMAIVIVGERPAVIAWAGIALILAGVFVVVRESLIGAQAPSVAAMGRVGGPDAAERARSIGVALSLGAAVAFGASNALSKVGMVIVPDAIQAGFFAAIGALLSYLGWEVIQGRAGALLRTLVAWRPWFWLAGVAGTTGQLTFYMALHFIAVGPATVISASEVVLTTALGGMLVQHLEQVTRRIALPAVLVFAGAALIAIGR
jgi:drug/metabolite transporter (DMT)-like permease